MQILQRAFTNRTQQLAVAVLFGLPLLVLFVEAIALEAGLFFGVAYLFVAMTVFSLIGRQSTFRPAVIDNSDQHELAIAARDEQIQALSDQVEELISQMRAQEHPVAQRGKRQLVEALHPSEAGPRDWAEETPSAPGGEVRTQYDALILMQKCLTKAQKLSGVHHMGAGFKRFRDLSLDNSAIDLRRLFDALESETAAAILVYSRDEKSLVFANDIVNGLFGWNADKFQREFIELIQGGRDQWEETMSTLSIGSQATLRLVLRTRKGVDALVHAIWCPIPTGVFQGMIIGIIYR